MAVTSLWKVKSNLSRVVEYAKNGQKTANPKWGATDYQAMRDVMDRAVKEAKKKGLLRVIDYAVDDAKTEQQYYVTGINCNANRARDQMQMTKLQFGKTGGVLAWHGYQSFEEGEVDADTAHRIGIELAKELWPDYQVIVATHLNTHCYHNHFVLNSVSFLHGGKFNACKESYRIMRATSDRLCKEHELSVIKEHQVYYPKHYAEWDAEQKGQPTWRTAIREDVDKAIMASMTWSTFLRALHEQGYEVKTGVKHIAVRPPGKERFVRLRSLGERYTEEAIRGRILKQLAPQQPAKREPKKVLHIRVQGDFHLSKVTWKGLRALYFFYLRKLRAAQRQPQTKAPYALREDIRKLDALDKQGRFLFKHHIDTAEQLGDYRASAEEKLKNLYAKRKALTNEQRRKGIPELRIAEIQGRITAISKETKTLRYEVKLCGEILERSLIIAGKQTQIKQMEKEEKHHVSTGRSGGADREHGDQRHSQRRGVRE